MMDDLDDLFAGASRARMQPSEALMARVLADADRVQAEIAAPLRPRITARPGFFSRLAWMFGGGGALAGVGSAAVAGLFLGFAQPSGLASVGALWASASVDQIDLMPGLDAVLAEE